MTTLHMDLHNFFLLALNGICTLDSDKQDEVIQNLAYKLEEWYDVTRDELRDALNKIGFKLEEVCVGCNQPMPDFDGFGDPLCSDCDSDADSIS